MDNIDVLSAAGSPGSGLSLSEINNPKGKKKLDKKKHTAANEQRHLRGHGSAKAKDKAGRAK
jgi:hypothetical protein